MTYIIDYMHAAHEHNRVINEFFTRDASRMDDFTRHIARCFQQGGKLLICGNGGSACDAMHIAGEFVGRFVLERDGLPAIALSADSGIITALANDYAFDRIYARQIEALATKGDIVIALSTSGKSPNILTALDAAKARGADTALFTGTNGASVATSLDYGFVIDSTVTANIQECSMMALHLLAQGVETHLQAA